MEYDKPADPKVIETLERLANAVVTLINKEYPDAKLEKPRAKRHLAMGHLPEYDVYFPSYQSSGPNDYTLYAANLMHSALEVLHQDSVGSNTHRSKPDANARGHGGTPLTVSLTPEDETLLANIPRELERQIVSFKPEENALVTKIGMDRNAADINRTHLIEKATVEYRMFNDAGDFKIEPTLQLHGFNADLKSAAQKTMPEALSFVQRISPTSEPYWRDTSKGAEVMTVRGRQASALIASQILELSHKNQVS